MKAGCWGSRKLRPRQTSARLSLRSFRPWRSGNKVPLLLPEVEQSQRREYLLCANLNSTVFDFVVRQKVQGQTLNLFIVEQLPVIPPKP